MTKVVIGEHANQEERQFDATSRTGRGRAPLATGTHGSITTTAWVTDRKTGRLRAKLTKPDPTKGVKADSARTPTVRWTAKAYVMTDGGRKRVQAQGPTKDRAVEALQAKLHPPQADLLAQAFADENGQGTIFTDRSTLGAVLDAWITDPATQRSRSPGTLVRYRHAIDKTIKSRKVGATTLANVGLDRVTPRVVTLFLGSLTPAVSRTCRGILRQALTYAVANGAIAPTTNGTFAMLSQRVSRAREAPRAPSVGITKATAEKIISDLQADEKTKGGDLPDLFRFLAGTGCRTSEATALTWSQLELDGEPARVLTMPP